MASIPRTANDPMAPSGPVGGQAAGHVESDTAEDIETPEGCTLTLRRAGPFARARAWLLDFGIRVAVYIAGSLTIATFLGPTGQSVWTVFVFAMEWLYPVFFEVLYEGATPGKRVCRLAVVREDGTPVDFAASFTRNTLRAVDFLPFLYGVGLLTMFAGSGFRRLGDLAAGTIVVYTDAAAARREIPDEGGVSVPPFDLDVDEQRAIIEYLRRAPSITAERAQELARASGLFGHDDTIDARQRMLEYGRYLVGHRRPGTGDETGGR